METGGHSVDCTGPGSVTAQSLLGPARTFPCCLCTHLGQLGVNTAAEDSRVADSQRVKQLLTAPPSDRFIQQVYTGQLLRAKKGPSAWDMEVTKEHKGHNV